MEQKMENRNEKWKRLREEYIKKKEAERAEYPDRFTPQWPYELFGIECGDGWKCLYQPIIDYIDEYNKDKADGERIEIHQIKEKFAELRFYTNFYTQELRNLIDKAEEESRHTCEVCGKHIDDPIVEGHWMYAECQECHDEWKRRRQEAVKRMEDKIRQKGKPKQGIVLGIDDAMKKVVDVVTDKLDLTTE